MYGWSDLIFTHITARLPANVSGSAHQSLINPYGLLFDEMTLRRWSRSISRVAN